MGPSPFYAYARSILDNNNGITWRYIMTFSSREDADEWWRIISQSSPAAGIMQRVTPQYYTFRQTNLANFIQNQKFAEGKTFQNIMFFTLLNDRDARVLSTFPQQDITDHINGKWYYIRSKSDPHRYWYCSAGSNSPCLPCASDRCNDVHVSTECRSRFFIRAPKVYQGDLQANEVIMIRDDQITIAPSKEFVLQITDNGQLKAVRTSVTQDIVFNDFTERFTVRGTRSNNKFIEYVVPVERGTGEAWELEA